MVRREFEYRPNFVKHLLGGTFFLLLFLVFIYLTITNTKGIIIGIIKLSKGSATLFYLGFTVLFMIVVINSFLIFYRSFFLERKIIIEKNYISAPKNSISSELIKVYYNEVSRVYCRYNREKITSLILFSEKKKLLTIPRIMIPVEEDFINLYKLIEARIKE